MGNAVSFFKFIFCLVLSFTAFLSTESGASENLLLNGSFEAGPEPGVFLPIPAPSTGIIGWFVVGEEIDYCGTVWEASNGSRSIDLDGSPGVGGIRQSFNTMPGERYWVVFDLAGNPEGLPLTKQMRVEAADQYVDFEFDVRHTSIDSMGWQTKSWSFIAESSFTEITFKSLTTGEDLIAYGAVIDNVSITDVSMSGVSGEQPTRIVELLPSFPNPFNPTTIICYQIAERLQVDLRIYNVNGRLVRVLKHGEVSEPGIHRVIWNGCDDTAQPVASGVYLCKVDTRRGTDIARMVLLK